MSSFDDYRKVTKKKRGTCCLCDDPVAGRVAVTLQARKQHPERTADRANRFTFPAIDSISKGFCEKHAIEVYEKAKQALP